MNYRKPIIKLLLLIALSVCLAVVLELMLCSRLRKTRYYVLPQSVERVFCGHSHMQLAVNDSIVTGSINYGEEGETYFYTLQKLEALLPANPQISTVFLEFTNNALSKQLDERTWRKNFLLSKLPKVTPFIDSDEFMELFQETPGNTLKANSSFAELGIKFLLSDESSFPAYSKWYRYYIEKKSTLDSLITAGHTTKEIDMLHVPSQHAIAYIEKIKQLCGKHKVKLVLMRSPTHPIWSYRANETMLDSVRKAHFEDLPYLDLGDFVLNNKDYRDDSHLNYSGATKLSHYVDSLIRANVY
jgi:hypothetical protein